MTKRYDRRTFLRRAAAAGLVAPTLPILACGPESTTRAEEEAIADGPSINRPVLLPWSADAVRISAPMRERPMAYVSRGRQRVFVDHEFRGRVNVMLAAHISVSSGLWRIPLLGDDLGVPIPADDALREFEEVDIGAWDPGMDPVEGDFRIGRGRRARVEGYYRRDRREQHEGHRQRDARLDGAPPRPRRWQGSVRNRPRPPLQRR